MFQATDATPTAVRISEIAKLPAGEKHIAPRMAGASCIRSLKAKRSTTARPPVPRHRWPAAILPALEIGGRPESCVRQGPMSLDEERTQMVERHLAARGISDPQILDAFRTVRREDFISEELAEFAYRDVPLPIGDAQTISQPYIVAITIDALGLKGGERVLEIGTGSGYAAAVLSRMAKEVFTVERHRVARRPRRAERLARLGYRNVEVLLATALWVGPSTPPMTPSRSRRVAPRSLAPCSSSSRPGAGLVIPVGPDESSQTLVRVTGGRSETEFREEPLADVRFVPLIGEQGWPETEQVLRRARSGPTGAGQSPSSIREAAEPIDDIDTDVP